MCGSISRRNALALGAAGLALGAAPPPERAPERPFLTPGREFQDVSRGKPVPHSLEGEALVKAKLTPEWVKTWIRNPRAVKPATWMPRIWYNSNSSSPEDAVRNEVEINAVVAYLFANSDSHEFAVKSPPHGDAASGDPAPSPSSGSPTTAGGRGMAGST